MATTQQRAHYNALLQRLRKSPKWQRLVPGRNYGRYGWVLYRQYLRICVWQCATGKATGLGSRAYGIN